MVDFARAIEQGTCLLASARSTRTESRAAARAIGDPNASTDAGGDAVYCLPLVVAGAAIGAIGISPDPPLTEAQRSVLAAAAALLGASVKNAELFLEVSRVKRMPTPSSAEPTPPSTRPSRTAETASASRHRQVSGIRCQVSGVVQASAIRC